MSEKDSLLHAIVRGDVQGVCFRAAVRRRALQLGLTGSAENLPDGSVEIYAQGAFSQLQKLEQFLASPGVGRVDSVEVLDASTSYKPYYVDFLIF
jgi:acylphosphatase